MIFALGKQLLCRTELEKIKKRALRRGIWFKVLSKIERIQVDLTIKVVKVVKSIILSKVLHSIVKKLLNAMESRVTRLMKEVGRTLVRKISEIGVKLGCKSAKSWINDEGFIKFSTIMYMNTPKLYKVQCEAGRN